ncbi:MAG: ATP-binding protein [Haloechinothrix sp.]
MTKPYVARILDPLLDDVLSGLPSVLLVGPRACGKTTTAARRAKTVVRLDREAEATAFAADPDTALEQSPEPVLLDEWQTTPGVLGAVKRAVDQDPHPNRFLITGSVRAELAAEGWPMTGRVIRVPMFGLTEREIEANLPARPLLDRVAEEGVDAFAAPRGAPNLAGYIERALRGGFPESVLARRRSLATQWLSSYVDQLTTRDAELADGSRDPQKLRRYLETLCLNTAGVAGARTLYSAAGIASKTAAAYDRLLSDLVVIDETPAWWTNRIKRLLKGPKRYIVDPGVAAAVLRLDLRGVLADGDLLGRLLDTFVMAQLRPEVPVAESKPRLHHLRTEEGRHEVDLLVEYGGVRVFGIEVKAAAGPGAEHARHLVWLRELLVDRFIGGVVLHTGPRTYRLGDRLAAAPIASLWC